MSAPSAKIATDRTASTDDIPALTEAYRDARKFYTLMGALLFGWELVGLDISPTPLESFKLTLKSPEAVPYVLIVLLMYFGFRFTVEWYQADARRRELRVSRIDFYVSHAIAIGALLIYAIQTAWRIQLVDQIPEGFMYFFGSGVAAGAALVVAFLAISKFHDGVLQDMRQQRFALVFPHLFMLSRLLVGRFLFLPWLFGVGVGALILSARVVFEKQPTSSTPKTAK